MFVLNSWNKRNKRKSLSCLLIVLMLFSMLPAVAAAPPSTEAEILSYSLPGQVGAATIDAVAATVYATVPFGTNVTALVATFGLSTGANATVGTTSQVSGTTANDFTSPVTYAVTAEDGITVKNWTVTVHIAADPVAVATTAVEAAEAALLTTQAEVTAAQVLHNNALALVNALADSTDKTALLGRLTVVQTNINTAQAALDAAAALAAATTAVEAAEAALLTTQAEVTAAQVLHNNALALVNALADSTDKTALLGRLTVVQTNINTAQAALDAAAALAALAAATTAVEAAEAALLTNQAEVTAAQVLHNNALTLVNALADSTDKTALLGRLTVVQTNINTARTPVVEIVSPGDGVTVTARQVRVTGRVFSELDNEFDNVAAWRARPFDEVRSTTVDEDGNFVFELWWVQGTSSIEGPFVGTARLDASDFDQTSITHADGRRGVRFTGSTTPGKVVTFRYHGYEIIQNSLRQLVLDAEGDFIWDASFEVGLNTFIIWAWDVVGNTGRIVRTINVVVPQAPLAPGLVPAPPTPTPPTVVEQPIVANQPTVVKLEGVVEVAVTAGAVTGEAPKISAQVLTATAAAQLIAAASGVGLTAASDVVVLTMTGGVFTAPVQLSLNFDAAKVATGQVPAVFVYNERTGRWIYLGGEVGDGNITVTVNRFSRFAVFASSPLPTLGDIANHWGRGSIRTLAGMAIVSGFPDGNFKPGAAVTRAEFVSMLTRALGLQAKPEAAAKFSDAAGWAQGAIGAAAEAGLISGYADGTFGGSRQITRAEMAVILQRVVRKGLVPVVWIEGKDFADANVLPGWAAEGIRTASAAGLVRGFQDGTFRPGSTATRAETATMLYRLVAER